MEIILILYGIFVLFIAGFLVVKIVERIKEKPKDNKDLEKYKKY